MPTLPVYVQNKVPGLAMVGVVLSMYGLWQAFIRLPLGIFADWLGRRKVLIIIGIALSGLGAYIMGTAQGLLGLIVGRAITGLAAGTWVLLVVVFSGLFPSSETIRVTSMLSFVGAAGRVLATGATGSLTKWVGILSPSSWRLVLQRLPFCLYFPRKRNEDRIKPLLRETSGD